MTEHETESKGPLSDLLDLVVHKSVGDFVDWDVAEAVNGHRFPTDYMEFIAHLGEGSFEESLGIRLPALAASDTEGRVCPISTEALADPLTGQWTDTDAAAAYTVKDMLIWGKRQEPTLCVGSRATMTPTHGRSPFTAEETWPGPSTHAL